QQSNSYDATKIKPPMNIESQTFNDSEQTRGGVIDMRSEGGKLEMLNCEFQRCVVHGRNMIYVCWGGEDIFASGTTFVTIANSMLTNCSAAIPGMIATSEHEEALMSKSSQTSLLYTQTNSNQKSNQLYDDGQPVFDDLYKHGLIFVESVNYDISGMISPVRVLIQNIFSAGCHSAVGSGVSIQKMRLDMSESIFIQPLCFGNIVYMNNTIATINQCYFKGRNGSYSDMSFLEVENKYEMKGLELIKVETVEEEEEQQKDELVDGQIQDSDKDKQILNIYMCPDNKNYYSSSSHGLVYAKDGTYKIHHLKFEGTQVGGVKVDNANATLINTSFVEDTVEKNKNFNGDQMLVQCTGSSNLEIYEAIINQKTEDNCAYWTNKNTNTKTNANKTDHNLHSDQNSPERCNFGVVQSGECNIVLSNKWILPGIPDPIISRAKLTVNVLNEKEPLKFDIEGEQIYPLNFQTKIVELRAKTKKEIKAEIKANKEFRVKYPKKK
ncbi:MAG: hypothetical protein EZS28_042551, partial [Streblomastix strix]